MPIITLSQVKDILQITDTSRDALIDLLIPIVQVSVMDYCKNSFTNINIQNVTSGIAFPTTSTITDSNNNFLNYHFVAGDYKISGSKLNDGVFEIKTVDAGTLTAKLTPFKVESAEYEIMITKVEFPEAIKLPVAQYIKNLMATKDTRIKSESLPGGYSVTYADFDSDSLPKDLLKRFRKPYW